MAEFWQAETCSVCDNPFHGPNCRDAAGVDRHAEPVPVGADPVDRIDIGGGTAPLDGYTNLDPVHGDGLWRRSILSGIPVPDTSVTAVRASHVLEHVHAGPDRIFVFNEVHRVLVPHGTFTVILPLLVDWHAIADPTHVSFWCEESFHYFDGRMAAHADYGISLWETLDFTVYHGWEGHWTGRPVKS